MLAWHPDCIPICLMLENVGASVEQYMNLVSARQKLVSSNIANADTPGYQTKDIDFENELQSQMWGSKPNAIEVAGLKIKVEFSGDIVLTLAFAKLNDGNAVLFDESIDLLQEGVGHDAHQRRRRHGLLAMETEEASGLFFGLQFRLIDVEVHAINAFNFQGHVISDDVGNAARYTHDWLRSTPILRDHFRLVRINH